MATAEELLRDLEEFLAREEASRGGPQPALNPGQRRQFTWPRPSVSAQYNVKHADFKRPVRFELHGEAFTVLIVETPFGFFGRCEALWAEAKGPTEAQMLVNLERELEPLFGRQFAISRTLGLPRRFEGSLAELPPSKHVQLLFCEDRDVAHSVMFEIDSHAASRIYAPALIRILDDESHPFRRTAQWCALDVLEDLPNVCRSEDEALRALRAVGDLMKRASDDYARTIYKAGDVLGDHVADDHAADVLLDVLATGSQPFGRRSAIHGLIHLCEWLPERTDECLEALRSASRDDPDRLLRLYAEATVGDIEGGGPHGPEPSLVGEG
jgi:hypothetical protein